MDSFKYQYIIPEEPKDGRWEYEIFNGFYDFIKSLCDYPSEHSAIVCSKYTSMVFESLENYKQCTDSFQPNEVNPIQLIGTIDKFFIFRNNLATLYNNVVIDNRYCVDFVDLEKSSLF